MLALGEPDGVSEHGERYTYTRITSEGGVGLLVPAGSGGAISRESVTYRRLNVFFDDGGRVTDARFDRTTCSETGAYAGKDIRTSPCVSVAGQDLLSATPPAAAGSAPGTAARIFAPALWHPGVRGFELGAPLFSREPAEVRGSFTVGGESILFFAADADRQSKPLLVLGYGEIADIALESFGQPAHRDQTRERRLRVVLHHHRHPKGRCQGHRRRSRPRKRTPEGGGEIAGVRLLTAAL